MPRFKRPARLVGMGVCESRPLRRNRYAVPKRRCKHVRSAATQKSEDCNVSITIRPA